jgi:excisionase family DNA binding protein
VSEPLRLNAEAVEALADRVAELVVDRLRDDETTERMVSTAEIARRFGVSRDYVYDHAGELGAVRLGDGRRAPLRFDPRAVADRLAEPPSPPTAEERETKRPPGRRKPASRVSLLPIGGGDAPQARLQPTGGPPSKNSAHAETAGLPGGDHG